jgi:hypothetical protein
LTEPIAASGARAFKVGAEASRSGSRITTIDLHKGETVLLTSQNEQLTPADLKIEPVAAQPGRINFFGSSKSPEARQK